MRNAGLEEAQARIKIAGRNINNLRYAKRKMAVWGGLTNSCEKKRSEKQRRKGKIYPFECRVPKTSKER